jgi:hypothetical protein
MPLPGHSLQRYPLLCLPCTHRAMKLNCRHGLCNRKCRDRLARVFENTNKNSETQQSDSRVRRQQVGKSLN